MRISNINECVYILCSVCAQSISDSAYFGLSHIHGNCFDFAVFNVADCFITVGGVLFCLAVILEEKGKPKAPVKPE